jgi:hypothetical protein
VAYQLGGLGVILDHDGGEMLLMREVVRAIEIVEVAHGAETTPVVEGCRTPAGSYQISIATPVT